MKKLINKTEELLLLGLTVGIIVFLLSVITVLYWQRDGIDLIEVSFMSIISGLYFFLVIIIANIIGLNKYIRTMIGDGRTPFKRIIQIFIILLTSFMVYAAFDSVYFLIDKSISAEYAEALLNLANKSGDSLNKRTLEDFAKLPFALQNGIVTFIFAGISSVISLAFIKKDGVLFHPNMHQPL
jgi:hypothetical protein